MSFNSLSVFVIGIVVLSAVLVGLAENSTLSFGWIGLIGAVVVAPFLIAAMSLDGTRKPSADESFWPPGSQVARFLWNLVAVVCGLLSVSLPLWLLVLLPRLPPGDKPSGFLLRVALIGTSFTTTWFWSEAVWKSLVRGFHHRASDVLLDEFNLREKFRTDPARLPVGVAAGLTTNWLILAVAAVALSIPFGLIDITALNLKLQNGPKQARGLAKLLELARQHIGDLEYIALLTGVVSVIWFVWKLIQSHRRAALQRPMVAE